MVSWRFKLYEVEVLVTVSSLSVLELSALKRRPLGAALALKLLARKKSGPLLVVYDAHPPNRIVMQEYQVSPVSLTRVAPVVGPMRIVGAPVFWRYLSLAELSEGRWSLKLYGVSVDEDAHEVYFDVAPGEKRVYEVAFAAHNWYPFFKPKRLEHKVYHGWRRTRNDS